MPPESGAFNALAGELPVPGRSSARLKLVAAAGTTLIFWSGAYIAISIAARELSPASLSLARLGSGALILLLVLPLLDADARRRPRRADVAPLIAMALLGYPLYHLALNAGQRIVPAGVASLLIAILPIFAAIIARVFLQEKPSARAWLGTLIAFAGVGLLVFGRGGGFAIDTSALLIVLSALSGACFMVLQRRLTQRYSGFALTIWGLWIGSLSLVPFAPGLIEEMAGVSREAWLAVAYLGAFPTALAYVTWAYVLKVLPAARATSLLYIVPPFTFLLAWVMLGEAPGIVDIVSGFIILGGIVLVQRAPLRIRRHKT